MLFICCCSVPMSFLTFATPWTVAHQAPLFMGFPGNSVVKEYTRQCWWIDPWVRKIPWRRKWQSTPVFLPGKCHGQRSLVGCSLLSCKRIRHDLVTKQQKKHFITEQLHGQWSLVGCSPWGHKESDMTEQLTDT